MGKITLLEIVLTGIPDAPTISSTSADSGIPVGSSDYPVTVSGTNFVEGTKLLVNGQLVDTEYVNSTTLNATIPASAINENKAAGSTVLIAVTANGFDSGKYAARSTDGGATWEGIPLPAPMEWVTYSAARSRWLACGENYVYYSDDDGDTWTQSKVEPSASRLWRCIAIDDNLDIATIVSAEGGSARTAWSADGGATWTLGTIDALSWERIIKSPFGDGFYAGCTGSGVVADKIAHSADGKTFVLQASSSNMSVYELVAGAAGILAANRGDDDVEYALADDAWVDVPDIGTGGFVAATYGKGVYWIADRVSGGRVFVSAAGSGWALAFSGSGDLESLHYSAALDRLIGGGQDGNLIYADYSAIELQAVNPWPSGRSDVYNVIRVTGWVTATSPTGSGSVTWDALASNG